MESGLREFRARCEGSDATLRASQRHGYNTPSCPAALRRQFIATALHMASAWPERGMLDQLDRLPYLSKWHA
jgi:hypothetical protein